MWKQLIAALALCHAAAALAAVDVNTASAADLDAVKGIGPGLSARILEERQKNGAFKDWADFEQRVKGVGEKNAGKFSAGGLTVNGKPVAGSAPAKTGAAPAGQATAKVSTQAAKPAAAATPGKTAASAPAAKK